MVNYRSVVPIVYESAVVDHCTFEVVLYSFRLVQTDRLVDLYSKRLLVAPLVVTLQMDYQRRRENFERVLDDLEPRFFLAGVALGVFNDFDIAEDLLH